MSMLEIKNVHKSFFTYTKPRLQAGIFHRPGARKVTSELQVLRGVDLTVEKGDVVAILGPSGSGKTTLLRCLNFLETADAGQLTFDGETFDLAQASRAEFTTPEGTVQERTAHAAMMFSRLVLHPATENDKNAILSIWNKKTGEEVVRINLADFLAQGRGAFEALNYSAQEFLDREYDYKLDFFLKGDKWQYVKLGISILDWSKRIQRADL